MLGGGRAGGGAFGCGGGGGAAVGVFLLLFGRGEDDGEDVLTGTSFGDDVLFLHGACVSYYIILL